MALGANWNADHVASYEDAIQRLTEYWPGVQDTNAPALGEGGTQAGERPGRPKNISLLPCRFPLTRRARRWPYLLDKLNTVAAKICSDAIFDSTPIQTCLGFELKKQVLLNSGLDWL